MTCVTVSDIRSMFTPSLSEDSASDSEIQAKIDFVESYVKYVYFEGGTINCTKISEPIKILVFCRLCRDNISVMKEYSAVEALDLGDYKIKFKDSAEFDKKLQTWEEMAHLQLKMVGTNRWNLRLTND